MPCSSGELVQITVLVSALAELWSAGNKTRSAFIPATRLCEDRIVKRGLGSQRCHLVYTKPCQLWFYYENNTTVMAETIKH